MLAFMLPYMCLASFKSHTRPVTYGTLFKVTFCCTKEKQEAVFHMLEVKKNNNLSRAILLMYKQNAFIRRSGFSMHDAAYI